MVKNFYKILSFLLLFIFWSCNEKPDMKKAINQEKIADMVEDEIADEESIEFLEYSPLTEEEKSFFKHLSTQEDLIVSDTVKRVFIMDENGKHHFLNQFVYTQEDLDREEGSYQFYEMAYTGTIGEDMFVTYSYNLELTEETKGTIIVYNEDIIHTIYTCSKTGCHEKLFKNGKAKYQKNLDQDTLVKGI